MEGSLYTVYYTDGTLLSYRLTDGDYAKISQAVISGVSGVALTVGTLMLKDIRSVVLQIESEENESGNPEMDEETIEWYKAAKLAEQLEREQHTDDEDTDYVGGMI
jgi:hypothetical protein